MNPFKLIYRQLYLLQLENYELTRFFGIVFKRSFIRNKIHKKIVWTKKTVLTGALAALLQLGIVIWLSTAAFENMAALVIGALAGFWITSYLFFVFLSVASILLLPLDIFLKKKIIAKAKQKLAERPDLKIVAITGSYGKTTMKDILSQVLKTKYRVLATPGSVNTPVGISRFVNKELKSDTEIFVVEMGAYYQGDIKKLCEIAKPDVAILTGINEQHIERFGNIATTIATKFEIVANAKSNATVILNADDKNIQANYQKYLSGKSPKFYSLERPSYNGLQIQDYEFLSDGTGQTFSLPPVLTKPVKIPLLGKYAISMVIGAVIAAVELGLDEHQVRQGVFRIETTPHRLEAKMLPNNILLIDDSYNGNPDGALAAMKVLKNFQNRRRIYVTPGLVELGDKSQNVHRSLGKHLAESADIVVLIKTTASSYIFEGLRQAGYDLEQVMWFDNIQKFFQDMKKITKSGDVVLIQNDWPESYM